MGDATGEPEAINEVTEEDGSKKNDDINGEATEEKVTEQNPENNNLDTEINKVEAETTDGEPKFDEQSEAEPTQNNENVEPVEDFEPVENFEPVEDFEPVENFEQVGSKERVGSQENFEFQENVTSKENVAIEGLPENQLGEEVEKGQGEEIVGEEHVGAEKDQYGEEQITEEQVESEDKKGEEGSFEEIEEEIENEDGTKVIKKVRRKKLVPSETVPLEQVMEVEEEQVVEEEAKQAEELPEHKDELEYVEEEEMREVPPDPAAPLDFSDSKEAMKPPFRLRPDQIAELESLWELYQNYTPVYTDIDGYITEKELIYMLKCLLLMTYTYEQLQELITFVCRPLHPKGHITYDQFVKMVTLRQRDLTIEEELRQSMKVMDFDNTGLVDREFFRETLITKGHRLTTRLVDILIKDVDITNDGTLGVEDVVGTMCMDLNPDDLELLRKAVYPDENKSVEEVQEEEEPQVEDTNTNDEDDDD